MPTFLENLKLDELSFVDAGANKLASVSIFKRRDANPLLPPAPIQKQPPKPTPEAELTEAEKKELQARAAQIEQRHKNFDVVVDELAARDCLPRHIAMTKARCSHPELFAKHQAEAAEIIQKSVPAAINKSDTFLAFEAKIDAIQSREGCSRLVALQKAARLFPDERRAYAVAQT
jgi:hypothetical protein